MTTPDHRALVPRILAGAPDAVEAARTGSDPTALVAAALAAADGAELLGRARRLATTTRDRQMVVIAVAHLDGDRDLVDALARDHLADHPDSVVVAWIAAASRQTTGAGPDGPHPIAPTQTRTETETP